MRRAILTLAALAALAAPALVAAQAREVVVYVVRHAERAEDGTDDPPISEAGRVRADHVAELMRAVRPTHLHTSDYKRTRSTLEPTAAATGLTPSLYDPGDLEALAARILATPGRHLVVGHSNTNPALVQALGGDPGAPIEEMEYDRAYVVVVLASGATGSAIFRFGGPAR